MAEPRPPIDPRRRTRDRLVLAAVVAVALAIVRMVVRNQDPEEYRVALAVLFLAHPILSTVALVRAWRGILGADRRERLLVWLIGTIAAFCALILICVWSGATRPRFP